MKWLDFNDADNQTMDFELIPKNTIARVILKIKPGGFNDLEEGWTGGLATRNRNTGAVFLNCEFTVTEGKYLKRKIFSNIGLYSIKGEVWGEMGRAFIKAMLCSARNILPTDSSFEAIEAMKISGFEQLNGLEFVARIDQETNKESGDIRNVIKRVILPNHKEYKGLMNSHISANLSPPWEG